jgi:hypothetical protein
MTPSLNLGRHGIISPSVHLQSPGPLRDPPVIGRTIDSVFFPHLTSVKQVSSARIFEQFRRSILLLLMMLLGAWTGTVQLFTHRRMSAVTTHAARALEINNYGPAEKLITYCNTRSLVSLCCDRR